MGTYSEAKSKFVKEKIKKTKFKDRHHIDNLLFLERSIYEEIHGWAGNVQLHCLKSEYEKEYYKIFEELNPKGFKKYIKGKEKKEEKEKKETEEFERGEREIKREEEEDWHKAGGRE